MSNKSPYVATYDMIGVPQGADFDIEIIYQEGAPPATIDLTGYSAVLQVKRNYDSEIILQCSTDEGTIIVDSASPNIIIKFLKEVTSALRIYSEMIYDLEITGIDGKTARIMQGKFSISREVTK
jgi:hypothetical protein